jgi:hypothetical protein
MDHAHMSWCTSVQGHDDDDRCEKTEKLELGEPAQIVLAAMPCSGGDLQLWLGDAVMYEVADLDKLIERLTALRPEFEAAIAETECDLHEHPEEE